MTANLNQHPLLDTPSLRIKNWWTTPSPELAYVYGFAFADGLVRTSRSNNTRNELIIVQKDRAILDAIRRIAPGGRLVAVRQGRYSLWKLTFGAATGVRANYLAEWGLVPNKTVHGYWPTALPRRLTRHYIRGFFDGDGHVSLRRRKDGSAAPVVSFVCHNSEYLHRLVDALFFLGVQRHSVLQDGRNYRLRYNRHVDLHLLYRLFYEGATIYDEQKRERFREVVRYIRTPHMTGNSHPNSTISDNTVDLMRFYHESLDYSVKEVSQEFGVSLGHTYGILKYKSRPVERGPDKIHIVGEEWEDEWTFWHRRIGGNAS